MYNLEDIRVYLDKLVFKMKNNLDSKKYKETLSSSYNSYIIIDNPKFSYILNSKMNQDNLNKVSDICLLENKFRHIYNDKSMIKEKFIKKLENFVDGQEVDIKSTCSECSTWYFGNRRCSCGNVRIHLEIDGDLLDGFYHYVNKF